MARGYQTDDVKIKLVELLSEAKTGLSGVEISEKLGINRVTMTKYLNIFAAEGLIRQKNIGNVNLWFVDEGSEPLVFPNDYFKAKNLYIDFLQGKSKTQVYNLIRNCLHSNAQPVQIMTEIIIPASEAIDDIFHQGKISKSEQTLLQKIISNSIQILTLDTVDINLQKNVIVISADPKNAITAEAASAAFHSDGWNVSHLGDMSDSIDVLFDLDLEKFLGNIWKQKEGIMIIVVFSDSQESLKFFAQAVNSIKEKFTKKMFLVLCSKNKKANVKADLITDTFENVLQWSQSKFESFQTK